MADDFVEDVYPIEGTVVAVLSATTVEVVLQNASKWVLPFGPGNSMALVLAVPPEDGGGSVAVHTVNVELVAGVRVKVTHTQHAAWALAPPGVAEDDDDAADAALAAARVPGARSVMRGLQSPRGQVMKAPCDQSATELIESLRDFVDAWDDTLPSDMPLDCFAILDAGVVSEDGSGALTKDATPEALGDALRMLLGLLTAMEARGRELGVFGTGTAEAIARTTDLQRTCLRATMAWATARSIVNLHAVCAPDYDITQANFGGFSVVSAAGAKKTDCIVLMEALLAAAAARRLRHVRGMVFAEQFVPVELDKQWAPAACTVPGCGVVGMGVMYASGAAPHARLCLHHAGAAIRGGDAGVTNVVFQTGASMVVKTAGAADLVRVTAAKPRWLVARATPTTRTGSKTWVPCMASRDPDILGSGQPQSIDDFIVEVLDRRMENKQLWDMYIQVGTRTDYLAKKLTATNDPAFPRHEPNTQRFAFANGMYSAAENKFYEYRELPSQWLQSGAINFISEMFDPLWTVQPLDTLGVAGYDEILDTQGYDPDTRAFHDAFMGRMLFRLGVHDREQVAPVLLGMAGSGKSTVARALMMLVREQNVGILASNVEEKWALSNLVGRLMVMCTEMKEDFKLPLSDLQLMIAGDPITVRGKNKDAYDMDEWPSHMLLIGNVIPTSWRVDEACSMERRVLCFRYDKKPSAQNPGVQMRFFENLGPFLVRIVRRYHELVARLNAGRAQNKFLRDLMPRQVVAFQAVFKSETSIAAAFVDHLIGSYDIGFVDVALPMDLSKDAELVELFRFMRDATMPPAHVKPRFQNLEFKTQTLTDAVEAAVVGTHLAPQACSQMVLEHRVKLSEVEAMYQAWWSTDGNQSRRGKAAPRLMSVLGELGLPVTTDAAADAKAEKWVFGLQKKAGYGAAAAGAHDQ